MTAKSRVLALAGVALIAAVAGCGVLSPPRASSSGGGGGAAPASPKPSPSSTKPYNVSGLLDPKAGKFMGIEANGAPDSIAPLTAFASNTGRKPNLVGQYVAWGKPFDAMAASNAWSYGALYYMAWEPFSPSVTAIADGQSDAYITTFAKAVRTLNVPIALSFGHEMNGWWYPWGLHDNSPASQFTTKPRDFIAAWRHIHDVFSKAGATNVKWVWTVRQNVVERKGKKWPGIKSWWPGGHYVDWVGMDGYFRRDNQDFKSVFGTQITDIRAITTKPIIIGETAVQMQNPNAAKQIAELFGGVRRTPKMLGFIWFDLDSTRSRIHWNIDSNKVAINAIRQELHQPPPKSGGSG